MAGYSIFGREKALEAVFAPDLYSAPSTFYVALTGIIPMAGDTGAQLDEPTDTAYARVAYGLGSSWWAPTGRGTLTNAQTITFAVPTIDWGLISGWALVDAATAGNNWVIGELVTPARVIAGPDAAVVVDPGMLQLIQL